VGARVGYRATAHDIAGTEADEGQPVDSGQRVFEAEEAAAPVWYVDLGRVAGDDYLRSEADAREEHLHLFRCRVLRLVEDDETAVERSTAHERQWCHLDRLTFEQALRTLRLDHVVQGVVQRSQVRIDLGHQVAGKEAQPLARFDGRTGEDDPLYLFGL